MQKVFFAFPYEYDKAHAWYRICLRNTVRQAGFEPIFADERVASGHVLQHVSECIDECEIGFYDMTGLNPNVLIEFGIGHASEKPCFLLINKELHQAETQSFWGKRTAPLPIPADLDGIVRHEYTDSANLAHVVGRVIDQNLKEKIRSGQAMANNIIERLKRRGPANMSTIARDINKPIDDVRLILRSLVATDRVFKEGRARGTTYRLPD
jgi:hypothetical protein